jgi:hypothetical protein
MVLPVCIKDGREAVQDWRNYDSRPVRARGRITIDDAEDYGRAREPTFCRHGAMMFGLQFNQKRPTLACVRMLDDQMHVYTCDFHRVEVPYTSIPEVAEMTREERQSFSIPSDGRHGAWGIAQFHIALGRFRMATDEGFRARVVERQFGTDAVFLALPSERPSRPPRAQPRAQWCWCRERACRGA